MDQSLLPCFEDEGLDHVGRDVVDEVLYEPDDPAGRLWLYQGNGTGVIPGGATDRTLISGGWGRMTTLVSPGNWNSDLGNDLLARDGAGRLWLYPGDASSGFGAPRLISSGWQGMTYLG